MRCEEASTGRAPVREQTGGSGERAEAAHGAFLPGNFPDWGVGRAENRSGRGQVTVGPG